MTSYELTVNELIASIDVIYLAVFANGRFNENQKDTLNDEFDRLDLTDDGRFLSRKLAQRLKAEFERDYQAALDSVFFALEQLQYAPDRSHRLMVLYMTVVESDGIVTPNEESLGRELADVLHLDSEYYFDIRTD